MFSAAVQNGLHGIHVTAAFLRNQILGNVGNFRIGSKDSALFPIGISLSRETCPLYRVHGFRRGKPQSEKRQLGTVFSAEVADFHIHMAVCVNGI